MVLTSAPAVGFKGLTLGQLTCSSFSMSVILQACVMKEHILSLGWSCTKFPTVGVEFSEVRGGIKDICYKDRKRHEL